MDEAGTSYVWEETFATDQEALAEFERALADEGLSGIVSDDR